MLGVVATECAGHTNTCLKLIQEEVRAEERRFTSKGWFSLANTELGPNMEILLVRRSHGQNCGNQTLHFKFLVQSLYDTPKPIKSVHLGPGDFTCLTTLPDEGVDGTHFKLPIGFGLRGVTCHPGRGWMMRLEITYVARFIN